MILTDLSDLKVKICLISIRENLHIKKSVKKDKIVKKLILNLKNQQFRKC